MAFTLSGSIITQTGTDANPEGLSAIAGVTTINKGNATTKRIVFDLGTLQLNIAGDLTHDPDVYEIIGNIANGIQVVSGADYKLGIERTVNGRTSYSKGTGLVSTFQGNFFNQFGIVLSGGTMTWNGGVMRTTGAISHSGCAVTSNTFDSVWQVVGVSGQWRSTGVPDFKGITMQGIDADCVLFLLSGFVNLSINFERAFYQTPASGGPTRTIENAVFANNQASLDAATNQSVGVQQTTIVKNPDVIPRLGKLSNNAYADFPVVQSLLFNLSDANGTSAENAVVYVADSDNSARKNATANGLPGGTVTSDYVTDRKYIATSGSNGVADLGDILTLVAIHNNLTDGTMNLDFRSNYGNNSVDFNVFLGGYDYLNTVTRQSLIGNGGTSVPWTLFEDTNVTLSRADALTKLSNSFTVDAVNQTVTVTADSTYDDLHDALKAYKYNGTQANFETPTPNTLIVTPNGGSLVAAAGWELVVNNGVTLSEGVNFNFVNFTTVTVNGSIDGIFASSAGTNTKLDVLNIKDGAAYIVADNTTRATIQYGTNTSGVAETYSLFFPPGSAGQQVYVARQAYGDQFDFAVVTLTEGGMFVGFNDIPDEGITQTNKTTVDAYTTLETTSKLYDYINSYRMTEEGIKKGAIVTRAGPILQFGDFSGVIKQNAASVFDITGDTITVKASTFSRTTRYTTLVATPPATWEADTNEVIDLDLEDANGDSSVTIQAGNVSTFEIWKLADGVDEDDYETGTLLDTVGPGRFRFIGEDGFKLVIRDQLTNYRVSVEMEKGVYLAELFFGAQVQLAQSATVELIYTLTQSLEVDLDAIKGTGFVKDKDSLINIRKKAALAAALSA